MKSLIEKMNQAIKLSWDCCYSEIDSNGLYQKVRELPNDYDFVWAWADGLMHKYAEKIESGRCSLQCQLDFDPVKFEDEVDSDIQKMKELLKKIGRPKRKRVLKS